MINWWNLLANSIWIVAVSLALAVFSIAYYQSRQRGEKLGTILNTSKFSFPLHAAGVLFSLGMTLTSDQWWEITLWVVLMVLFVIQIYLARKKL